MFVSVSDFLFDYNSKQQQFLMLVHKPLIPEREFSSTLVLSNSFGISKILAL